MQVPWWCFNSAQISLLYPSNAPDLDTAKHKACLRESGALMDEHLARYLTRIESVRAIPDFVRRVPPLSEWRSRERWIRMVRSGNEYIRCGRKYSSDVRDGPIECGAHGYVVAHIGHALRGRLSSERWNFLL